MASANTRLGSTAPAPRVVSAGTLSRPKRNGLGTFRALLAPPHRVRSYKN